MQGAGAAGRKGLDRSCNPRKVHDQCWIASKAYRGEIRQFRALPLQLPLRVPSWRRQQLEHQGMLCRSLLLNSLTTVSLKPLFCQHNRFELSSVNTSI